MQAISIERTEEAVVIKLPLSSSATEIQDMLNYFKYVQIGSGSRVTDQQIEELAKEGKSGWWERNKSRFIGKEGFEGLD
jgi:hypothetical protein